MLRPLPICRLLELATEYQRWYMYGQVEGHGSVGSGREGGGQKKGKKGKKGRGRKKPSGSHTTSNTNVGTKYQRWYHFGPFLYSTNFLVPTLVPTLVVRQASSLLTPTSPDFLCVIFLVTHSP